VKTRLLPVLIFAASLFALAGCGDSGGASSSEPASIAPPTAPIFVEAAIQPDGRLRANVDAVVETVAGVDDLGELIVSELESSAQEEGEPFDFDKEVAPWLGEQAGVFLDDFDGEDFNTYGVAVQTTDPEAAQEFVDRQAQESDDPIDDASYEGVDYKVDASDETVFGVVGELLVISGDEQGFKAAVDASEGDSLADEGSFDDAMAGAPSGSLADVYLDVGLLIEQSGETFDEQALQALETAGIKPREATAVASLVPNSDEIEINVSSDLGDQEAPSGDASELLGSLPGDSFAAFAVSGFGEQLQKAIDQIDKEGIPGQIEPNELRSGVKELGIDLDEIAGSLEDASLFATGTGKGNVGGALVLTTGESREVAGAVSAISALVRQSGTPGVSAVTKGGASGFSIRDREELGPQPLVVATKDDRLAIGYGLAPTLRGLAAGGGASLSSTPDYKAAVAALGDTPIGGFVDGQGALRLAESLVPRSETGFQEAKQYLDSIRFVAIGSGTEGDRATAKLIVGLEG
jgi:hypothetical protein